MYKPEWVDSLKEGATRVFGLLQFDICGHSELSKSIGPSAMQKIKKRLRDMGGRTAYLYGGWELGFLGDGAIYAFLEDQGTVSDPTVEAGLHILHELIFFNELIMIDGLSSQPIALRLSCHRGEAKFSRDPGIMHGNAMNRFFKHERDIGLPDSIVITAALYDNLTSKILRNRFEKHKFSEKLGMDLYRPKDLSEAVVEMTKMATEFKAYEIAGGKEIDLPLLPQPIYTYTDAEGKFDYGIVFAFALGQNPEVFITFEKYPEGISCELTRIGGAEEMHVLWREREIWWSDLGGEKASEFLRSYINFSYADLEDGKLYVEPDSKDINMSTPTRDIVGAASQQLPDENTLILSYIMTALYRWSAGVTDGNQDMVDDSIQVLDEELSKYNVTVRWDMESRILSLMKGNQPTHERYTQQLQSAEIAKGHDGSSIVRIAIEASITNSDMALTIPNAVSEMLFGK